MASSSGRAPAEYTAVRVKNFNANTTDTETLHNIFASCGNVKSAILVKGQGGQSGAACYIHFEEHESAKAAVEQMNGAEVNEARIEVEPAHGTPSSSGAVDKGSARLCSIFVKGFGPEVGTQELKEVFKDAGEIVSAVVMRDQAGASRGFGFVNFLHPEGADRAVAEHGSTPPGQGSWLVRKALPKMPKQEAVGDDPCTLYVRGLEADVDRDMLAAMFQAFGTLLSCRILTDPKTGISRCAGLLRFETPEQARHAIRDMHGRQVRERRLHVTIAQNGPRFQRSAPRDFAQPRPPPGMPSMYPPAFPAGMSGRFPAAMSGPMLLPASPEQAQLLAAQQSYMRPAMYNSGMFNPGMMFMGPQAYPQPMWPQGYFTGSPYSGSPLNEYGSLQHYQQQQVLQGMSRQQQAQQYYMMTSGQDGTYFDVASNTFMDAGRGYRGVPIPSPPRRARRGGRNSGRKSLGPPGQSDSGGTSGALQEAAERASSGEGSLSQAGQPTMPKRGAQSLSAGQLDCLMCQLTAMSDDKSRKDFLGGHLFALLEVDHSEELAGEITSQLLAMSEEDILHMLQARDALDAQVARVLNEINPPAGDRTGSGEPRGGSLYARDAQAAQHSHKGPAGTPDASAFSNLSLE